MTNTNPEIVKILVVNTGATPISTEKYEFPATDSKGIHDKILEAINRLGKNSHALLKYKGRFWVADHTARKGPSKEYYKHEVQYHPMMKELV
jgi:hypothetical protein